MLVEPGSGKLVDLDMHGELLICGDDAGVMKLVNVESGQIATCWETEISKRNIFRVGFFGGNHPIAIYLQENSLLLAMF